MAKLEFHVSAENRDFLNKLNQVQSKVEETTSKVESEGNEMDSIFKKVAASAAAMGAGFSVQKLVSDIVRVRGEFQQLEIAMETMLGSQEKATALMSQLTQTAAKTPFGLTDIAQGAKQLLAYGTASEEVNETLVRLGNIASGLSIPLNDLVYLYGTTMTQGRLFTQDLRQFMGRGIPLADELAKQFNTTKDKVGELVTEGKVGFPEVQRAIEAMTNEGGKFFNLMEKQSASLTGQISNLEDAWDMMLNEIGTKTQGVASAAIHGVSSLIENYERVGKIVMDIALIYGTYKAAVAAVSVVQKINTMVMEDAAVQIALAAQQHHNLTVQQAKSIATTNLLTAAKQKLIATMKGMGKALINPYTIAAAAVTSLAFGIYKLVTYQTEAEKAQKRLNKAVGEADAAAGGEIRRLDELKGKLAAAKKGSAEYLEVKEEIVSNFGKYDDNLSDEIDKVGDLSTTYDRLRDAIRNAANERMYSKYVEEETKRYDEDVAKKLTALQDKLYEEKGVEQGAKAYQKIWQHLFMGEELDEETQNIISSFDEIRTYSQGIAGSMSVQVNEVNDFIIGIRGLNEEYDEFIDKARVAFGQGAETSDFFSALKKLDAKELEKIKKNLSEGLTQLQNTGEKQHFTLVSGEDIVMSTEQEIKNAIAKVDSFLATLNKEDKESAKEIEEDAVKKAKQAAEKVAAAKSKAELELRKAQTDDEIKLIEIERDAKVEALEDELEAYKAIYEAAGKDTTELEEQFARMIEIEKQMADIDIKAANKKKDDKNKEELDELAKEFETYQQAVTRIQKEYEEKRKKMYNDDFSLKEGFTQGNADEVERQKNEAIAELAETYATRSEAFKQWADDLSGVAVAKLKQMLALAKAQLQMLKNTEGADELEIAQAEAAVDALESALSESNDTTKDSKVKWTDLSKTLAQSASVFEELGSIIPGVAGEVLAGIGSIANGAVEMANGIQAIGEAASAAEKASAILAVISVAIRVVGAITRSVTDLVQEHRQANLDAEQAVDEHRRALLELADQKIKEKYDTAFGKNSLQEFIERTEKVKAEFEVLKNELASLTLDKYDLFLVSMSKKAASTLAAVEEAGNKVVVSDMRSKWQKYWGTGAKNVHVLNLDDYIDESGKLDAGQIREWLNAYGEGLSDETYKAIESLVLDWEAYGERVAEINEYIKQMFGNMSSTVADSMIDSWIETGNAIADAKDILGDYARTMAKAVIESKLLKNIFTDEAAQQMADLVATSDTEGALSILAGLLEEANALAPEINSYLTGVDEMTGGALKGQGEGESDREAYKKGIATASQESVDENNSRLTTIQLHTYSINDECKKMSSYGAQMLARLTSIEKNTAPLGAIATKINDISIDIEDIKNKGVKML